MTKTARKSPDGQLKQPFDLEKYFQQVNASAFAAEQFLQIPAATISSIPYEPDFIAAVKAYAVVEPLLNDLIATWPPKSFAKAALSSLPSQEKGFRNFVLALNIGGRSGRLALARTLKLLSNSDLSFIEALVRVRNRYAHNVKNMHRSLIEILQEEQKGNANIVAQLTGLQEKLMT